MICLVSCRSKKPVKSVRVWFIVNTGSNCTFLAKKTIEALIGPDDILPSALLVAIQEPSSVIECHISSPTSHYENANVLGMMALHKLEVYVAINWKKESFCLVKQ